MTYQSLYRQAVIGLVITSLLMVILIFCLIQEKTSNAIEMALIVNTAGLWYRAVTFRDRRRNWRLHQEQEKIRRRYFQRPTIFNQHEVINNNKN